ncbi:hypothetical protein FQN49_003277 [Arthroderma sp. PD_2]|nr:hypothetical protein FQN49_003277 [Arthroderma sp. PD_2]
MPSLFKKWLRKRPRKHKHKEKSYLPIPTLPVVRARPLTAIPCSPSATENSSLFQRIPPDIRWLILIEAFKGPPVQYDPCLLPPLENERWKFYRPSGPLPADFTSSDHDWLRCDEPGRCNIGAMGWLLTCRQAYIEGIQVLYTETRLCIQGTYLLRRLPDLLLPQRCSAIRSVELYWNIHPWRDHPASRSVHPPYRGRPRFPPGSDMEGFISLLKALPAILPNLVRLYLSLQGDLYQPEIQKYQYIHQVYEVIANCGEKLLQHVDQMVANLHRLVDCRIALTSSYYRTLKAKEKGIDPDSMEGKGYSTPLDLFSMVRAPMWRDLPIQNKLQRSEGTHVINGYWVINGYQIEDGELYHGYSWDSDPWQAPFIWGPPQSNDNADATSH